MGCDIHVYGERREGDKWVSTDKWSDPYGDGYIDVPYDQRLYSGRNYRLFALLADVRNYDEYVKPFSEPRGLPEDVTPEVLERSKQWGIDGHSHSYFTCAELMRFDWTTQFPVHGVLDAHEFHRWDSLTRSRGESPNVWCAATSRETISENVARKRIEAIGSKGFHETLGLLKNVSWAVQCEWTRIAYQDGRDLLSRTLPQLWRLGKPEDVRIVFWFDN